MINIKNEIIQLISNATNINKTEIENYIEVPKDVANGDYAFPCFKLAKTLKSSIRAMIASGDKVSAMKTMTEYKKIAPDDRDIPGLFELIERE